VRRVGKHCGARGGEAGFTIVELLVYFAVAVVVIAAVYNVMAGQNQLYSKQRELQDVRGSLRAAANLLAYEFRQASAAGDLYFVTSDSFAVRSIQGTGIVCGIHSSQPRLGLWGTAGDLSAGEGDSALVFMVSNTGGSWFVGAIDRLWTPDGGGVSQCDWDAADPTEIVATIEGVKSVPDVEVGDISIEALRPVAPGAGYVEFMASHPSFHCSEFGGGGHVRVDTDNTTTDGVMENCSFDVYIEQNASYLDVEVDMLASTATADSTGIHGEAAWNLASPRLLQAHEAVRVGAPFRAFRRVQYGIYEQDGRWWLGQKVSSAELYDRLIGPLLAPEDSGLVFTYYDVEGDTTNDPLQVHYVDIIIRGESLGRVRRGDGQTARPQEDEVTIRVSLRG
jgi:type II secretory pathway pseudopilin PulG